MKTSNNPAPKPASTPAPDNFPVEWLTASGPRAKAIKDWIKANNPPDLALLMDLYKVLVFQFMRDKGPTEDCIRQVTPMLRTITSYEQNLSRQNHRERALKLEESEHELEMAEAARKDAQELVYKEAAEAFAAHQPSQAKRIAGEGGSHECVLSAGKRVSVDHQVNSPGNAHKADSEPGDGNEQVKGTDFF